jgi:lysine decarboxylase
MATHGRDILERLIGISNAARKELSALPGIEVLGNELIGEAAIAGYDPVRLVISARKLGVDGYTLYSILRDRYNIEIEFGDYFYGVCVMGLGAEKEDVDRLVFAMKEISAEHKGLHEPLEWSEALPPMPPQVMTPRAAHFSERDFVHRREACGRVSAQMIVPYPPGIPVLCPGELITEEVCDFLDELIGKGRHFHGSENEDPNVLAVVGS